MRLLTPVRQGVDAAEAAAVGVVRLTFASARLVLQLLGATGGDDGGEDVFGVPRSFDPDARPEGPLRGDPGAAADVDVDPTGPAPVSRPGGPARAAGALTDLQTARKAPEPTSAAGASGGVAGTAAAPGDAARAGAPDPTAADAADPGPTAPRTQRRARDVTPAPRRPRQRTAPTRGQMARRRAAERDASERADEAAVETEGAAAPGAQLRVDAPWEGYDAMKANEIVKRVREADPAVRAVVRLYEQTHRKRKSVLAATDA